MRKPSLNRNRTHRALLGLLLLCLPPAALALSTDKDQPIQVEADSAQLDDKNNVSVYTGNVVLTQGSIRMTGDKMTVYNTEDDKLDTLIMVGHPATYRQLPDNSKVYDEAQATTLKYYELKNLVILTGNAVVKQENFSMKGERIEYDTKLNKAKAESAAKVAPGTGTEKKERVRVILKKKTTTGDTPSPPATPSSPPSTPSSPSAPPSSTPAPPSSPPAPPTTDGK